MLTPLPHSLCSLVRWYVPASISVSCRHRGILSDSRRFRHCLHWVLACTVASFKGGTQQCEVYTSFACAFYSSMLQPQRLEVCRLS